MASHLHKSELAVKLFLHRRQISFGKTVKRNIVIELLRMKFTHPEYFHPTRDFYNAVSINQVRWWDLYYGRKSITQQEYLDLTKHFNITLEEAFEVRQLVLFDEDHE
jgi:hypothetical protein